MILYYLFLTNKPHFKNRTLCIREYCNNKKKENKEGLSKNFNFNEVLYFNCKNIHHI
jgi:hypothetical protein